MDVMKRNLLILALLSIVCIPAYAGISSEEYSSPEYMINSGWSEATAEQVFLEKNRKAGKPAEPLYDKTGNKKYLNFFRNIYGYVDPSIDTEERYHHDIHLSPSWKDL